jgi:hypothetical protein
MNRLGLAGALAVGALMLSLPAAADDDKDYRYKRHDSRDVAYRAGFKKGLDEGLDEGRKDANRGRRFELRREDRYRDGDHGYRSQYGPRREYVQGFRAGYERGYEQGYEVRGNRGRSGRYRGYDDRRYDDRYERDRYEGYDQRYDAYDYQDNGRHRHRGRSGWCDDNH